MKFLVILVLIQIVFSLDDERNKVSDEELQEFTEELLKLDYSNAAHYVRINYQGHRKRPPEPLLIIDSRAFRIRTIWSLLQLYDNNICYAGVNEWAKKNLLDSFMVTPVMEHTMNFLAHKGLVGRDPNALRGLLYHIWFTMYHGEDGTIRSCGFKHVFLGEWTERKVSGMHNWVFFGTEEAKKAADYKGYYKRLQLGRKGAIVKLLFSWANVNKPVTSMFVGTSPELEMALYTVCFLVHSNEDCHVSMARKNFSIQTYSYPPQTKYMIGSAYPVI